MTKIWIAEWEIAPGDGVHTEQYSTLAAAKLAMRNKISQTLNLEKYISRLNDEEEVDCKDAARFLANYFSDPQFPYSPEDVPLRDDAPDHCDLWLSTEGIRWCYWYNECPQLRTNIVLDDPWDDTWEFDFWYGHPEKLGSDPNIGMSIRIREEIIWGTSAYPLMVLLALRETPQTQEQIIGTIYDTWNTSIDRKAVGRHLQLLQDMGFPVQKCPEGYYRTEETTDPKADIQYGPSAYPLMILQVLDGTPKTQAAIIRAVQQKYGTKMGRKAVSRHMELLKAMHFKVM